MAVACADIINSGMVSQQLKDILLAKHADAVCVEECKDGRSWGSSLLRLDLWVLLKTWSPWTTIGYEIKVRRSDFLNDNKWQNYLPYCHLFYFVCPPGVIHEAELPEGVGLMVGSKNIRKLFIKRKAIRHEPDADKLCQLMSYVLMSRVPKIVANMYEIPDFKDNRLEQVRYYLKQAEERGALAEMVHGHVRQVYDESRSRICEAENLMNTVRDFSDRLSNLGINWNPESDTWDENFRARNQIEDLRTGITLMEVDALKRLGNSMVATADKLQGKYFTKR